MEIAVWTESVYCALCIFALFLDPDVCKKDREGLSFAPFLTSDL